MTKQVSRGTSRIILGNCFSLPHNAERLVDGEAVSAKAERITAIAPHAAAEDFAFGGRGAGVCSPKGSRSVLKS
jgi:hypothetical protein